MQAGRLRHRVELQKPIRAQDASGEIVISWLTYATVWAFVKPLTGQERLEAQQVTPGISHEVRMRYRRDVISDHHVLYDNRTLEIDAVIDVNEQGRELRLICKEIV